jgi:predicted  nucleic acid-binding Zn-ribbon protein
MGRSTEHFLTWQSCVVLQMQLRVCHTCTVELPDAATLDL